MVAILYQKYAASTVNSSAAALNAGVAFTGTSESLLGVAAIMINFTCDAICIVEVQQSSDGTFWDFVDSFVTHPDIAESRIFKAISAYFKVVVTNDCGINATYLRLQSLLCAVAEPSPSSLTEDGLPKMMQGRTSWIPSDANSHDPTIKPSLNADAVGNLQVRSQVLTDEAGFREDFSLANPYLDLTGTVYFRNGSMNVIGSGTSFLTQLRQDQYIKLSGHADSVYMSIAEICSDTQLMLDDVYTGATASGTGRRSTWKPTMGTGGSIATSTSELALTCGTTASAYHRLHREGDYGPFIGAFRFRLSQRIVNQEIRIGFGDSDSGAHNTQALVVFDGATNTACKFRTGSISTDLETTNVTLPGGATTANAQWYWIEVNNNRCALYINDVRVAEHKLHIPGPYDTIHLHIECANGTTPATSTIAYCDAVFFLNHDRVETTQSPKVDPIPVREYRAPTSSVTSVSAAATDTVLLIANGNRLWSAIYNDSSSVLYLKLGTGASGTSFTIAMTRGDYFELPANYVGPVNGYWQAAQGSARITEIT